MNKWESSHKHDQTKLHAEEKAKSMQWFSVHGLCAEWCTTDKATPVEPAWTCKPQSKQMRSKVVTYSTVYCDSILNRKCAYQPQSLGVLVSALAFEVTCSDCKGGKQTTDQCSHKYRGTWWWWDLNLFRTQLQISWREKAAVKKEVWVWILKQNHYSWVYWNVTQERPV